MSGVSNKKFDAQRVLDAHAAEILQQQIDRIASGQRRIEEKLDELLANRHYCTCSPPPGGSK